MINLNKGHNKSGFTLIEIIIVITVISILSTITIVSYSSWQQISTTNSVKSDLINASAAMENARNFSSSGYPGSLSGIYESSPDVVLSLASSGAKNYCIDASSPKDSSALYYINSQYSRNEPQSGTCAGMPGAIIAPTGLSASTASTTTISLNWNATVPGATGYALEQSTNAAFSDAQSIGSFGASPTLPYIATGLSPSTTYYYRIQAFSATSVSPWSTTVNSPTANNSLATPAAPVVTANTVSSTTTFSWPAVSCGANQKVRYQYRYTIAPIAYDSGWVTYSTVRSLTFTTSTEGQTYSVAVQAQCYNVNGVSVWVAGSASYYRLIIYTLTTAAGTGGTVSVGGTYNEGTTQTITATPKAFYTFTSWTGSTGCSGVASHTILMNATKSCTANFTLSASWLAVGTQIWAKTSLNVGTMINTPTNQTNNGIVEKYCYNNTASNCTTYGGLYQWNEAMQYVTTNGAQGICQAGSHYPTDAEWKTLEMFLGMTQAQADAESSLRGTDQGTKLKSGGSSGLNFLLTGGTNVSGQFISLNANAYIQTSTLRSGYPANMMNRELLSANPAVWRSYSVMTVATQVRCIAN